MSKNFIPDSQFKSDEDALQESHGTLPQQGLAAIEGAARGLSFGLSDKALVDTGTDPKDIRARMEANPGISTIGNIVGGVGALGTVPIGAAAEAGLAGTGAIQALGQAAPYAARAAGYGIEGAALGAGNTISDAALGDTKLNAQKVLTDIGMGAAFGAGLGLLSKGIEASPGLFRKAAEKAVPETIEEATAGAPNEAAVFDNPSVGINPTSIEDIKARVKEAGYRGESAELPQKSVLEDAASRVEMLNPIHPLQLESLDNQAARDLYKTALEMSGEEGAALKNYEALQKQELTKQTKRTIETLAPEAKITGDATEGGKAAIDTFTEQYQKEKDLLRPAFESLKQTDISGIDHLPGVIDKMTDAVPGVARMFDAGGNELKILPYKTAWGIDKATYTAVKDAVESLEGGPKTFEELSNIRKGLDQNIDILSKGQAPQEIMALKKSMMDYMQDVLSRGGEGSDATSVRELFKRYAVNEQQRGVIEKAFGASVGSPEFGAISKIKPEMISDRIFSNTATVNAAKDILPAEKFNHLAANWLAEQVEKVTDKGSFSSNKFGSFLKKNQDVLSEAFKDNPGALNKLKDINNIMRILPDSASINPSGTAKTLLGILKAHSLGELVGNIKGYAGEKIQHRILLEKLNANLAGKADQATKLSVVQKTLEKTSQRIESAAKSIFSDSGRAAIVGGLTNLSTKSYNDRVNRIRELANHPTAMMDHLSKSTDALYASAPNITQDINNTMVTALNFLNSKIPAPKNHMPLSGDYVASPAQKDKFNTYFEAVNNPIMALSQVKDKTLTNETMEALQVVHPDLLSEMRMKVMENFNPEKAKNLDYAGRISLAKFLGEPLDEHMLPQVSQSYQASLSGPELSQQSGPKNDRQKSTLGGLKQLNLSGPTETRSQQLQKSEEI